MKQRSIRLILFKSFTTQARQDLGQLLLKLFSRGNKKKQKKEANSCNSALNQHELQEKNAQIQMEKYFFFTEYHIHCSSGYTFLAYRITL